MKGLNRIKIVFDPEQKKHHVYGWNSYFYPNDPEKEYEDWEALFPLEDVEDWETILTDIIKGYLTQESCGNA